MRGSSAPGPALACKDSLFIRCSTGGARSASAGLSRDPERRWWSLGWLEAKGQEWPDQVRFATLDLSGERGLTKLLGLLRAGDPCGEVSTARQAKEAVRALYEHTDPELAL